MKRLTFSQLATIGMLANVGAVGAAFGLQILLARLLGPNDFGIYAYTMTWVATGAVACKLGLDSASLRYIPQYLVEGSHDDLGAFLRSSWVLTTLFAALVASVGYLAFGRNGASSHAGMAFGFVLLPLVVAAEMLGARLQALKRMPTYLLVFGVGRPALIAAAAGGLYVAGAALGLDVVFVLTTAVVACLTAVLLRLSQVEETRALRSRWTSISLSSGWLETSWPLWLISISQLALARADVLVVGAFFTPRDVGVYAVASQIAALVTFGITATNQVMAPTISELYVKRDAEALQVVLRKSAQLVLAFTIVVGAALGFAADTVLGLFGAEFVDGAEVLLVLMIGQVAIAYFGPVGFLLTMTGHERDALRVIALTAFGHIALCTALASAFGVMGAATGTVIAQLMRSALLTSVVSRRLRVNSRPF